MSRRGPVTLVACVAFLILSSIPATAQVTAAQVTALAAGGLHTCAVFPETGLACWGYNFIGQLGDGSTAPNRLTPQPVKGLPGSVKSVAAGRFNTCAVTDSGGVFCWGTNSFGALGHGTSGSNSSLPVAVAGLSSGMASVATGHYQACAVRPDGVVICWGESFFSSASEPRIRTDVPAGITAASLGAGWSCFLTRDGAVFCGGTTAVSGLETGAVAVAVAHDIGSHACAVTAGGSVLCWGDNSKGQLGDGTTTYRPSPVVVNGLGGAVAVTAGLLHSCALTAAGSVLCWGDNVSGQIGDGTTTQRLVPVQVSGLSGVTAIAAGSRHTCAATASGVVCWGDNQSGQLGDGTTTTRLAPVGVRNGPVVSLDHPSLTFSAVASPTGFTAQTPAQTVRIVPSGVGTARWTAISSAPWLTVSPASGTAPALLTIAVQPAAGLASTQTGAVTLAFTGAANDVPPIAVALTVASAGTATSPPLGVFETPYEGPAYAGSIAVTGWALDDVGVQRVELWRDLLGGETTPPFASTAGDPRNGKVFVDTAGFVAGARPDVEKLYATTPLNYRAGWGYLLLTWGLWDQGNGDYQLYAYAIDAENNIASLGKKTIRVRNAIAFAPFGSIDTPAAGGNASGPNFGWALTPKVDGVATCKIPANGIFASIDSGPPQPVVYGDARTDVAGNFKGFANSDGAGGHLIIDWSTLSPGLHTIGWTVRDDCGRQNGVGSRFFNVTGESAVLAGPAEGLTATGDDLDPAFARRPESSDPITVARGYGELPLIVAPGLAGSRIVEVPLGERIEMRVPRGFTGAQQIGPGGTPRALPIGSTWDAASGTFSWQPAPGFLGTFRLVFSNGTERISVRLIVTAEPGRFME